MEPLRQFMSPKVSGDRTTLTPADSPREEGDDGAFEYHNPRKAKSAAVGPPRSSAAAAAAAGAVSAGALAGLVSMRASSGSEGEEK